MCNTGFDRFHKLLELLGEDAWSILAEIAYFQILRSLCFWTSMSGSMGTKH